MHKIFYLIFSILGIQAVFSHPMPNSIINLRIKTNEVKGQVQMPLLELHNALKMNEITGIDSPKYRLYFAQHLQVTTRQYKWKTRIDSIFIQKNTNPIVGEYSEVWVDFTLIPQQKEDVRTFELHYDAIIHQVVTHEVMVFIQEDWENGIHPEGSVQQMGVIKVDIRTGNIFPLQVSLQKGTYWKGFVSLFLMGMKHIREGLDHLFFLFSLLLISPLAIISKKWTLYQGTFYTLKRFLSISLAFTLGHSITLLIGAFHFLLFPSQYIELLIALSIVFSAINVIFPIFKQQETKIAAGFGLIHGLAFSFSIADLDVDMKAKLISILGFNLGIEAMQFIVMLLCLPLLFLSKYPVYHVLRIVLGGLIGIAAMAWFWAILSGHENIITTFLANLSQ